MYIPSDTKYRQSIIVELQKWLDTEPVITGVERFWKYNILLVLAEYYQWKNRALQLETALECLMDVQNGPPLIELEKAWNEAMQNAQEALIRPGESQRLLDEL